MSTTEDDRSGGPSAGPPQAGPHPHGGSFAVLGEGGVGCYAVIFTSQRTPQDRGYGETADRMVELASQQPGYLGVESARGDDGLGITVSYWRSLEDIAAWRRQLEHTAARNNGRAQWYTHYELRIAKVERAYAWDREGSSAGPGDGGS